MNIWIVSSLFFLQPKNCNDFFAYISAYIFFIDESKSYVHVFNEKSKS